MSCDVVSRVLRWEHDSVKESWDFWSYLIKLSKWHNLKWQKYVQTYSLADMKLEIFFIFCHFLGSAGHFIQFFYDIKIFIKIYQIWNQLISFIFGHWPCDKKISMAPASEFGRFLHFFKNRVSRLHRCWWRILVTGSVGVNFEILVTDWRCWRPIT